MKRPSTFRAAQSADLRCAAAGVFALIDLRRYRGAGEAGSGPRGRTENVCHRPGSRRCADRGGRELRRAGPQGYPRSGGRSTSSLARSPPRTGRPPRPSPRRLAKRAPSSWTRRTRTARPSIVGDRRLAAPDPDRRKGGKWLFDSKAGRQEILYRRIGGNELDAIQICRGYVEAQHEYASRSTTGRA